eukprot:4915283-Amphidinium_carterae.1
MRAETMQYLQQIWESLKVLECSEKKKDNARANFVRDLRWTRSQFVREVFHTLECWEWTVPPFLARVLQEWSQSWWSTVIAENSLRE